MKQLTPDDYDYLKEVRLFIGFPCSLVQEHEHTRAPATEYDFLLPSQIGSVRRPTPWYGPRKRGGRGCQFLEGEPSVLFLLLGTIRSLEKLVERQADFRVADRD